MRRLSAAWTQEGSIMSKSAMLCVLFLAVTSEADAAEDSTDVTRGGELARAWCANCHAVERGQLVGPYMNVPNFTDVARLPSTTAMALRAFLSTPHPSMPNVKLTAGEVDEIIAYIMSLRSDQAR
jgi:mono/diheme cytochrome c family protein